MDNSVAVLLTRPIVKPHNALHFSPTETQDPLKAIDEWLTGWADRLTPQQCWNRFKEYSPFYRKRISLEPEPFFYGGHPYFEVFCYRYKQFVTNSTGVELLAVALE